MEDESSEIAFADSVPRKYIFQESLYALRDLVDKKYTPVDRLKVLVYLALILRDRVVTKETVDKVLRALNASTEKFASELFLEFRGFSAWRWIDSNLLRPEVFRGLDLEEENDPGTVDALRSHVSGKANHFLRAASAFMWTNKNWAVYLKEEPKKSGKYILAEGEPNANGRMVAERGEKSIVGRRSLRTMAAENEPLPVPQVQRVDECANRLDFPQYHASHAKVGLKKGEERSCLYYLLIRVNKLKPAIVAVNKWAGHEMSERDSHYKHSYWDMSVWSTLGDADVIVRFRTSTQELAQALADKITSHLKGETPSGVSAEEANYLADSSGREGNPQLIAVDEEFVNGVLAFEPESKGYLQGRLEVSDYWDSYAIKSCRYFVFIHYPHSENRGREQLESTRWYYVKDQIFRVLVDSISSCRDFSPENGSWMVLEGYLSCGGISELSALSEKLESAFDSINPNENPKLSLGTKKTHIAYALKYQWDQSDDD